MPLRNRLNPANSTTQVDGAASDATRMQMRRMVDRLIAGERIALAAE